METWWGVMRQCQELGRQAEALGEAPVGAIVIHESGDWVEAHEATRSTGEVTAHAELLAIRHAVSRWGKDLSQCTLVTSSEPCVLCSYAIRFHRLRRVVYLHPTEFLGGVNSAFPVLTTDQVPLHWAAAPEVINLNEQSDKAP